MLLKYININDIKKYFLKCAKGKEGYPRQHLRRGQKIHYKMIQQKNW